MKKFISLLLSSIFFLSSCSTVPETAAIVELNEPAGVTYDTFAVAREDFFITANHPGYVVCHNEPLYFTKGGLPVKSVETPVGVYVKKGDPLVTLETESIDKQIAELEKSISETVTRNGYANNMKEIDIQIALLEIAETKRDGTENDIKRKEFAYDRLLLEAKQLVETQEQELSRRYSQLDEMKSQLEDTVIYAPFDGRVVQVSTRKHNRVQAYRPVIYLADETKLEILYSGRDSLSGSRNSRISARISDKNYDVGYIEIPMDEYLKYIIAGTVPPSRFEFLDEKIPDSIKPWQFAEISVISREEQDVLLVPVNSIYRGESDEGEYGAYVYIMENGQKVPRAVELGYSNESYYIVKNGVEEGDEVFVKQ